MGAACAELLAGGGVHWTLLLSLSSITEPVLQELCPYLVAFTALSCLQRAGQFLGGVGVGQRQATGGVGRDESLCVLVFVAGPV